MEVERLGVPARIEALPVRAPVGVVGQLRLDHQAGLVARLEELRHVDRRVVADEIEACGADLPSPLQENLAVCGEVAVDRVEGMPARATEEKRLPVEKDLFAPHLQLADAEALEPRLQHAAVRAHQLDLRRVEIRRFRRPWAEIAERDAQHRFTARRSRRRGRPALPVDGGANDGRDALLHVHMGSRRLGGGRAGARPSHRHVHLRHFLVEVAACPGVVDPAVRRRRLELDVAQDAGPVVLRVDVAAMRRCGVVDLDHDHLLAFAGLHEIGDVVLEGLAAIPVEGDVFAVDPEVSLRIRPACLEPDAPPLPLRRQLHGLAVPGFAVVEAAYQNRRAVPGAKPGTALLRLGMDVLQRVLEASRNLHAVDSPRLPEPFASVAGPAAVSARRRKLVLDDFPFAAQRQRPRVAGDGGHRIDDGGMRPPSAPHLKRTEIALVCLTDQRRT